MYTSHLLRRVRERIARAFTWLLAVATIFWSLGTSVFLTNVPMVRAVASVVLSGGGPGDGQNFVPLEAVIDFNSNANLNAGGVNTSNVTLYPCTGATDATSCTTPDTTTNKCSTVTVSSNTHVTCAATLVASTTYRLQAQQGGVGEVVDTSGNTLASAFQRIFRTSSISQASNTTPPRVWETSPGPGANHPANGNIMITFPQGPEGNMKFSSNLGTAQIGDLDFCQNSTCGVSIKKIVNFVPTTEVCTGGATCLFAWNASTRVYTINPGSNLEAGSEYDLCLRGTGNTLAVKNQDSQSLPADDCRRFTVAAVDSTGPTLATMGTVNPANGTTDVSQFISDISVRFSEGLDSAKTGLSYVRLCADSTSGTAGCEVGDSRLTDNTKFLSRFDSNERAVHITPLASDSLAVNTKYCIEILGGVNGVSDMSGNTFLASSSANCFTTGNATDNTKPTVSFVDADNFKAVARFSEPMRATDFHLATTNTGSANTSNIALECPTGVPITLTGKTVIYSAEHKELEIQGLGLPTGQTCKITITNARDLAGNVIDTTNSSNIANFTVQNSATTGGFIGSANIQDFHASTNFATFWEKPTRCEPRNRSANKATSFECEFPVPGAMPISSTVLLTFPSGFTLSTGDGTARLVPGAQSFTNTDMNGPESGTLTATASVNAGAKTITLTTVGAALGDGSMMRFEFDRITTPVTAAEDLRVSIVAKNDSGVKIGQTLNAMPFGIQEAGAYSIAGTVCKGTTSGGTCAGGDTAIASAKVVCDQMGGFVVGSTSSAFMGHQEATSNASGDWSITGLTPGDYSCFLPPDPTAMADTIGTSTFQKVSVSNANRTDIDFKLKDLSGAATGVKTLTVSISGGPTSDTVDIFCHAGAFDFQFSAPIMKAVTLVGGAATATLKLQESKTYDCGMGPHVAFEQFSNGGPPPVPTFTFMPPKSQKVVMDADKTVTFALQANNRTITGSVVDGSSTGIANVFVRAEPVGCFGTDGSFTECHGGFAQTKSDGTFSLSLVDGTYEVGADSPGLPQSTRETANVTGANVTGVTLKVIKSSTTVSGTIKDESGNGIKYAHVNAEKRTITTGSDACDFANTRPSGGFSDSPTNTSGDYTLYVGNGTWCVRAFSPSYGEVGTKTVTVSGSSLTGQNISASSSDYGTISGTVTKAASNVSGAFVNCYGSAGGNNAQTGSDGIYTMKVKAGTYSCDGFAPGIGSLGRASSVAVTAGNTTTQAFTIAGNPGTITVTATALTEGFCDARDSTGIGSGAPIESGTATIKVTAGTYTVRCGTRRTGPLTLSASSVVLTAGGASALTATVPTLRTVAGRVTDGTNNLGGASLKFTSTATGSSFNVTTGTQSGVNNNVSGSNVPEGTYNVEATKKGYEPASTTASVSGGNFTFSTPVALTPATGANGDTVTVTVQESAAAYTGEATVVATSGTKTIVGGTNSNTGTVSMDLPNGTWTVKAIGDNGKESSTSTVTVSGGSLSGSAPTLSLATNISGYTAKNESQTFPLSTGGLLKYNDLAVGGVAPEISVSSGVFSTTDSSNAKMEMKSDASLASIDPGTDENFVGTSGYDITPKDANGNKKGDDMTGSVTITIPYTDANVSSAAVDETKLSLGAYNTTSQTWETFPTTVDTTNNLIIATVDHFSSFGIIGGVTTGSGGSSSRSTTPNAATNIKLATDGTKVTVTWTDPTGTWNQMEVLRDNNPIAGVIGGSPVGTVEKGVQKYEDTNVTAGKTYQYVLRTSTGARTTDSGTYSIKVEAGAAGEAAPTPAPAPATPTPAPTPSPGATPATPATPAVPGVSPAQPAEPATPPATPAATVRAWSCKAVGGCDKKLTTRLKGRILVAVGQSGEAFYVSPVDGRAYYLGRPLHAFNVMRFLSLGISEDNFAKVQAGDKSLWTRLRGRILLRVDNNGEAWYLPDDGYVPLFLGRPHDAFRIMREQGLGVSNDNLQKLDVEGELVTSRR